MLMPKKLNLENHKEAEIEVLLHLATKLVR